VTAQAVRKESKSASKLLLSKVGKTLMGRLSHIRHKNKQKSSFSANGYNKGFVSRLGRVRFEPSVEALLKDSDIDTISIISGFESRGSLL
jgi:hypothetical protein